MLKIKDMRHTEDNGILTFKSEEFEVGKIYEIVEYAPNENFVGIVCVGSRSYGYTAYGELGHVNSLVALSKYTGDVFNNEQFKFKEISATLVLE